MSNMNDRQKGFENKFAHEEQRSFEVEARCAKIFGLWAAQAMGMEGDEARSYALSVVETNLDIPGFEDIMGKVLADLKSKGVSHSEDSVRLELDRALQDAQNQILRK